MYTNMYATAEQMSASNKQAMETLLSLANFQLAAYQRIAGLSLDASRCAFEDSVNYARAVLGAKDVHEVVNLNAAAAQPALEKVLAHSRKMYEATAQSQREWTQLLEAQAAEAQRHMAELLDKFSNNGPAGSDVAVAAAKSAIAAVNTAYQSFSQVVKQASEVGEANFSAAVNTAKDVSKKSAARV